MTQSMVELTSRDGVLRTWIFRPEGAGPWPAVLFFMDGIGIRPAMFTMAERIAAHGYLVALPDLFHRSGPYEEKAMWAMIMDLQTRPAWRERYYGPAMEPDNNRADVAAVLEHLAQRDDVIQPRIGTTGYCMGGNLSLCAAAAFPERVAAAASFHGGYLVTDDPDSPHRRVPPIKARVYVAGAVEDASFTDEMKQRLEEALTAAGVEHVVETYEGARHGFAVPDHPVYNPAAAERHYQALFALLDKTFKA